MSAKELSRGAELVQEFLNEVAKNPGTKFEIDPADYHFGKEILDLPAEDQADALLEAMRLQVENIRAFARQGSISSAEVLWFHTAGLKSLISTLLRKHLPFSEEELLQLTDRVAQANDHYSWQISLPGIIRTLERHVAENGLSMGLATSLRNLLKNLSDDYADSRKARQRLVGLLQPEEKAVRLSKDEVWTRHLLESLQKMEPAERDAWGVLLEHCASAGSAKPSKKWLTTAEQAVLAIGDRHFSALMQETLAQLGKPGTPQKITGYGGQEYEAEPTLIHTNHSDLLRGLIWCTSLISDEALLLTVGDAAEVCFKKLPGIGPRCPKVGNACLWTLSAVQSPTAVAQLTRLKARAKHASIRKQLGKAMDNAAQKAGLTTEDLEEIAVPTCGLTACGELHQTLGDFTALLEIDGTKAALSCANRMANRRHRRRPR